MSTNIFLPDGRLFEAVFKPAGGDQTFGIVSATGQDLGREFYPGSSTTNAGFLNADGTDIGRLLMGNVNITAWGVDVKNYTPGVWTAWMRWQSNTTLRHKFTIGGNGSGNYTIKRIYSVLRSGRYHAVYWWKQVSFSGNTFTVDVNVDCGKYTTSVNDLHVVIYDNIAGGEFDIHYGYYYQTVEPCSCDNDCYYCSCDSCDCD